MRFLEKGVYKIFGAVVLVSMIGALVAEPMAVGDIGAALYYALHKENGKGLMGAGEDTAKVGGYSVAGGAALMEVAEEGSIMYAVGAGLCVVGASLLGVGVAAFL